MQKRLTRLEVNQFVTLFAGPVAVAVLERRGITPDTLDYGAARRAVTAMLERDFCIIENDGEVITHDKGSSRADDGESSYNRSPDIRS